MSQHMYELCCMLCAHETHQHIPLEIGDKPDIFQRICSFSAALASGSAPAAMPQMSSRQQGQSPLKALSGEGHWMRCVSIAVYEYSV